MDTGPGRVHWTLWGDETVFSQWRLCIKDVDQSRFACLARNMNEEYEINWNNMNMCFIPSQPPFLSTCTYLISSYLHNTPTISNHLQPSPTISNHLQPSPTISNHLQPFAPDVPWCLEGHQACEWGAMDCPRHPRTEQGPWAPWYAENHSLTKHTKPTGYTRTIPEPSRTDFCQVLIHLYPILVLLWFLLVRLNRKQKTKNEDLVISGATENRSKGSLSGCLSAQLPDIRASDVCSAWWRPWPERWNLIQHQQQPRKVLPKSYNIHIYIYTQYIVCIYIVCIYI